MIRIMILDDDEMYLKKEKDITEQYFAEKNVDCTTGRNGGCIRGSIRAVYRSGIGKI